MSARLILVTVQPDVANILDAAVRSGWTVDQTIDMSLRLAFPGLLGHGIRKVPVEHQTPTPSRRGPWMGWGR